MQVESARSLPVRKQYQPSEIKAHAGPVDYRAVIQDARVVYLGDVSGHAGFMQEMTALLPQLKQLDFTHLAIGSFLSATQNHLELYLRQGQTRERVIRQELIWHRQTQELDEPNWLVPEPESYAYYFDLADAARKNGLKVNGLEWCRWDGGSLPTHFQETYPQMGLSREALRELDQKEGPPSGHLSELYRTVFEQHQPARNWHAAGILSNLLRAPEHKVAVLVDRQRFGTLTGRRNSLTLDFFLRQRGGVLGPAIYYSVEAAEEPTGLFQPCSDLPKAVFSAVSQTELAVQRFMLAVAEAAETEVDYPNFVIHLP